jgi:valyl-tRNA synthetase
MIQAETELKKVDGKLNNESFRAKAPKEIIEKETARREELSGIMTKLKENIEKLK